MKKLLLFFTFALLALSAGAQTSDTTYIEYRDGAFYRVTISNEFLSVDTAATIQAIIGEVYPRLESFGVAAVQVINLNRARKLVSDASAKLASLTGSNYYNTTDAQLGDEFLGDYNIRVDGGSNIAVSIIRAGGGTGQLRFRQGGTNFVLNVVTRNYIRIRRYQGTATQTPETGAVVELFLDGTAWKDLGGRFVLRRAGVQGQSK